MYDGLAKAGVGENLQINIECPFPPSYKSSYLGVSLTEDQLQERFVLIFTICIRQGGTTNNLFTLIRCYMLNKWMQAVFGSYPSFSPEGQSLISGFLSLEDNDEVGEANKELILSLYVLIL